MGWLRRLRGEDRREENLELLVRRLTFYLDQTVFQDALQEATSFASRGDDFGVRALSEAISIRSRRKKVEFPSMKFSELEMRSASDPPHAMDRLMDLAQLGRLLYNPSFSQQLIVAILNAAGDDGAEMVKQEIFVQAGADQGFDFQLLYCHTCSSIQLNHDVEKQSVIARRPRQEPRSRQSRVA